MGAYQLLGPALLQARQPCCLVDQHGPTHKPARLSLLDHAASSNHPALPDHMLLPFCSNTTPVGILLLCSMMLHQTDSNGCATHCAWFELSDFTMRRRQMPLEEAGSYISPPPDCDLPPWATATPELAWITLNGCAFLCLTVHCLRTLQIEQIRILVL